MTEEEQRIRYNCMLDSIEKRSNRDAADYPNLYHYTSMNSFQNMVFSSHEFWFSDASYQKDKTELLDFINNLKKAVEKRIEPENNTRCDIFFEKVYAQVREDYPFIFCFCRSREDVAQWERYADNAKGVCVKFNTKNFSKMLYYLSGGTTVKKVFYNYDAADHKYCRGIQKWIENDTLFGSSQELRFIRSIIISASQYKHWSYQCENEVRAIIYFLYEAKTCDVTINGYSKRVKKVKFIKPCAELGIDVQDLFDEIIIGPKCEKSIERIKEEFRAKGFEKLAEKIKVSECPLQ